MFICTTLDKSSRVTWQMFKFSDFFLFIAPKHYWSFTSPGFRNLSWNTFQSRNVIGSQLVQKCTKEKTLVQKCTKEKTIPKKFIRIQLPPPPKVAGEGGVIAVPFCEMLLQLVVGIISFCKENEWACDDIKAQLFITNDTNFIVHVFTALLYL